MANRSTFTERLCQAFVAAQRGALPFAILYLDLDKFKPVNDTFGHPVGDSLLQQVAARLKACTRDSDLIARLGGDEFAIIQGEMRELDSAGAMAAKIQAALASPYLINGQDININFARDIGIVVIAQGVETDEQRDLLAATAPLTQAQGFHFSKAVGADRAGELLRNGCLASNGESLTVGSADAQDMLVPAA